MLGMSINSKHYSIALHVLNNHISYFQILEQSPGLLHLDRRFQVKCLNKNCHPTWVEGYKAENNENPQGNSYRTDVYTRIVTFQ